MRVATIRRRTQDRVTSDLSIHTIHKLGARQSLTPEGYLLCEAVPIARTGRYVYGPGETPVSTGRDGIVHIERTADEVFKDTALRSFEGKPVTDDHPDEDVSPHNFKEHVVGITQNVRRGEGLESDYVLADLLIHDNDAIAAVRDGKREISCGYDAEYGESEPGRGWQYNIMGNHVALVSNGRAGARCSIKDRRYSMATAKPSKLEMLMGAFKAKDAAEVEALAKKFEDPAEEGAININLSGVGTQDANTQILAALTALQTQVTALTKDAAKKGGKKDTDEDGDGDATMDGDDEDEDEGKKMKNMKKEAKDLAPRLEILSPGAKLPTHDAEDSEAFAKVIHTAKRKALDAAFEEHEDILAPLLEDVDIKKASRATVDGLFIAAAELVKNANNSSATRTADRRDFGKRITADSINEKNKAFWAAQGVRQ